MLRNNTFRQVYTYLSLIPLLFSCGIPLVHQKSSGPDSDIVNSQNLE